MSQPDIWVTSDTHFFHKNILKYQAHTRPFADVDEMNEALIERWNSCVKPGDMIYHLGDFGFAIPRKLESVLKRLNGQIYGVFGNHDQAMHNSHIAKYFVWQREYAEIKVDGTKICLFHYPIAEWNRAHHGSLHFHGHLHSDRVWGRSMDVGSDSNNCYPHNVRDLITKLKALPIRSEYHEVRETED